MDFRLVGFLVSSQKVDSIKLEYKIPEVIFVFNFV